MIANKRFLYIDIETIIKNDMIWGLMENGIEPQRGSHPVPSAVYSDADLEGIIEEIRNADIILSQDFSPVVAEACHRLGDRIYISWIYDSPQRGLYMKEAGYPECLIFVFDRCQLKRLQEIGLTNVYYQPLAANVTMASILNISEADIAQYGCDISFVGNLYKDPNREAYISGLSSRTRAEVERILATRIGNWGEKSALYQSIDQEALGELWNNFSQVDIEYYSMTPEFMIQSAVISREASQRERILVLNALGKKYGINLYTKNPENCNELEHVRLHPAVSQEEGMLKVFYASRINLNITMASIESGIPLRVFDIMSVGGFAFSNWQEEIGELFVPEKEIVTFRSVDEMLDKAGYYLKHESERLRIALSGYQRVRAEYNCKNAMECMLIKTKEVYGI